MTDTFDLPDSPLELARLQDAVAAKLSSVSLTPMTDDDVLLMSGVLERSHRRSDGVDARVFAEVSTRGAYRKAGAQTPGKYLTSALRLSAGASKRRLAAALAISPMYNYSGDQLDPTLPATAAAVADGDLSVDHINEIVAVIEEIPAAIPAEDKAHAEAAPAELSRQSTP
ncbi:MAG: 13E12 repeat family protein, partial [Gordonia sp. (in: high G+C Gram-positive bacteria)]|nr:13E12 repeat family protein [Gordonia sp. (in: high G+C Gram-positive bacteria)]